MSWMHRHSLRHRILESSVPLVLCGPMLRRVEPTSVSVFLALKHARDVTLEVFEGLPKPRPLRMRGTARTTKLGEHLHVAVVTATSVPDADSLTGGRIYLYNLRFASTTGGTGQDLANLGMLTGSGRLGFEAGELPSFALPPNDLERLRLIHASCRKPHGESLDALEGLEMMMVPTWTDPLARPHQLFLGGDQIYADDVADSLLLMLMDADDTLLGWSELGIQRFPDGVFRTEGYTVTPSRLTGPAIPIRDVLPGHRSPTARNLCRFTAHPFQNAKIGIDRSHLLTFGEYATMYLFAWSSALWPDQLPGFSEIYMGHVESITPVSRRGRPGRTKPSARNIKFTAQNAALAAFRDSLDQVRRALANVPTYMMFDDHEITDDWFLNRRWCQQVLSSPLGPWAIQNGLSAFAVFQAWGNLPARFTPGLPGGHLLSRLAEWSDLERRITAGEPGLAPAATAARAEVNERVGVGADFLAQIEAHKRLPHPPGALDWHYRVTGPGYEVLMLDTRTWRAYPGNAKSLAVLISEPGLQAQISQGGESQAQVTLVVSPVPVIGVPLVELIQETGSISVSWTFELDAEAWGMQPAGLEHLLSRLARRLPQVAPGKRRGRVVLLSGDVHYGFAARFQYWAVNPFDPGKPFNSPPVEECEMVAVQFTASALRNEEPKTHILHTRGYRPLSYTLPHAKIAGWNNHGGSLRVVGWKAPDRKQPIVARGNPARADLETAYFEFSQHPHWKYRIDYLLAQTGAGGPGAPARDFTPRFVPVPPPNPQSREQRRQALAAYLPMSDNHADYLKRWGNGKEIVGVNNLGEISFVWDSQGERAVVQDLWWRLQRQGEPLPMFPLTTHVASLRHDDSSYPEPHREANP